MLEILYQKLFYSHCGTSKYRVRWRGDYTDAQELIDLVDGSSGNYGGWVGVRTFNRETKEYTGEVHVYYD